MPFCTQCGHQNPDGARFCSQCGNRLDAAVAPSGGHESPSESTATITFGGPVKEAEHREDRALGDADAAAVDALPPGSALLVVQRGPSAGSRFLLDTDVVAAGRHPESEIFLDDVTVSRRHAELRRTCSPSPTSAASTAPTSTATGSTRWRCRAVTRCRSASTASSSSPATAE